MARREGERDRSDRHSRSREKRSSHRGKDETKEERLLRKAKEYVEEEEKKRRRRDASERESKRDRDGRRHERTKPKKRRRTDDDEKGHRSSRSSGEKRRRHGSDSSDSSSGGRRKERIREDSKKRHKKHGRSHRESRKEKKHDRERNRKGDRKKELKRIKVNKGHLYPLGNVRGSPPEKSLDVERDYFSYHQHLWVYLYREEGRIFGDLTSEEARGAFERFARRYNDGKLEVAYYDPKGIPSTAIEECKTTRHAWSFNTSETERQSLKILQEGVKKQTDYDASQGKPSNNAGDIPPVHANERAHGTSDIKIPEERRKKTAEERLTERAANKRLREHVRTAEEEFIGGRKDGRERQIEKRKEKALSIHAAAKDRESAMGGVELDDDALYGAGEESSFKDALAREKRRTAQRKEQKSARVAELQQKEQDKQEEMLKMLGLSGLKPGQKITIAPRKDG